MNEIEETPVQAIGSALSVFTTCLEGEGVEFVGIPDPNSTDPVLSDAGYAESLGKCANESGILEAFDDVQAATADLTRTRWSGSMSRSFRSASV